MSLKNIVVFADPSPAGDARARYAVKLSLHHGAHLIGIFVVPSGWQGHPAESFVRGHDAIRGLIERYRAEELAASDAASRSFKAITAQDDISFEFRVIRGDDAGDHAKLHSLHADVVIVGYPGPGGLPEQWSAEGLLLATGVPFLIVPDDWKVGAVAERVLVGWNASREARRAITDSLPLLTMAQSVAVIVVDPARNERHGEEPGADVALYLSRHGANVTVEQLQSEGRAVADVIMDYAARDGVDLIVLGAYSHARSREIIFGGVTRSLLMSVAIPMLIAH